MNFSSFFTWKAKVGAVVILVLALIGGYLAWASHQQAIGEARATTAYNKLIAAQKKEAAAILAKETVRVATAERALQDFKNNQEVKDGGNKKTVDALSARVRALAGLAGRLRDPHADAGCGGRSDGAHGSPATGPGNSPGDGADAPGLLSAELAGLLQRLTLEADQINNAYISCRADAEAMRAR